MGIVVVVCFHWLGGVGVGWCVAFVRGFDRWLSWCFDVFRCLLVG